MVYLFDAVITFDLKSGKAEVVKKNFIEKMRDLGKEHRLLFFFLFIIVCPIVFTIIIEVIIALFFRIKELKVIVWTNIATQIFIQLTFRGIINSMDNYYLNLLFLEIVVFIIEYLNYRKNIESINEKKILLYTLIANGVTYGIGLVMFGVY
ncbi:hypothetical protein [Oceanirhabdus sp. W0125-5]|uniref:hypothetical protein n=1 Tax=Oceanirhabdus sp. W0125-5 TaxID=2999116 RepID=UPI0022F32E2F|nr:hypothetical protein [Oceanirhabdus sp. W0125-5]WBW96264.1 hypothetical protein OW730_21605 [Oceanirhabdus sp. W0125-5]